ncbi:pentapeptide repeat-containing protein [Pannus brasiliensis CCIBt3594]|uniref:Pentapeptide repeat-containing protein n=1 Tax=Pannus brasiliensis CCIBt3594 TaxID=1427578 RepID=A0AAW9QEB8_9CHRO
MMVTTKIKLAKVEIRAAYALGKRQFPGAQLPGADLRGLTLSGIDLTGANLAGADLQESDLEGANLQSVNLQGANLCGANLKKACLRETNLQQAYLTRVELSEADLTRSDLEKAYCKDANFARAILEHANLHASILKDACLQEARLEHANLRETWLAGADLERANLAGAFYDDRTRFSDDFDPITARMLLIDSMTVEDMTAILTCIYQFGCKYLGATIAHKYWEATCPRLIWLERFPVTPKDGITFAGDRSEPIDNLQLQEYRQWMDRFAHACSSIVRNFRSQLKKQTDHPRVDRFLD